MFYIFTALKCEATALINSLNLKKSSDSFLKIYEGDQVRLVITNPGKIKAASAVSYIAGKYGFYSDDFLLNIGVCAGKDKGKLFWINKVSDMDSNFNYYPDMIYRFNLPEMELRTSSSVVEDVGDYLADMEGSSICEVASAFMCPHQIVLLKAVSDSGKETVTPQMVTELIDSNLENITSIMNLLKKTVYKEQENPFDEDIYLNLKCSEYMRSELNKLLIYARNSNNISIVEDYLSELKSIDKYPVSSKKEGKEVMDELRKRLI